MDIIARAILWITLLALLLVVPRWTRTHSNVMELSRMQEEVSDLQDRAATLERQNNRTIDHIIALSHAPYSRTALAKQKYDLIGPTEVLIRFDEED